MRAQQLLRERRILGEGQFADIVIWRLPGPVPGSGHEFKYRLAFVVDEVCVLRFDNETGRATTSTSAMRKCRTSSRRWKSWWQISGTRSTSGATHDDRHGRGFLD